MTALNCVRLLLGRLPSSLSGLSTAPATATWPAGALSNGTVKIRPLCNGLELGSGGLQHEELAAGVSPACWRRVGDRLTDSAFVLVIGYAPDP